MRTRWPLFLFLVACPAVQFAADKASIEGRVVNRRTGAPLAGVQVRLEGPSGVQGQVATGRKGDFSFSGLDAAQYRLAASRAGFVPLASDKVAITLAAGEQVGDLTVRLTPHAVISGSVLDSDGSPMANVPVQLLRRAWGPHKRVSALAGTSQSNDAGEFRIAGLAQGEYLLRVQPRGLAVPPAEDKIKRVYVNTWYPSVTDASAAIPLHLAAGEERPGIEVTLQTSKAVNVRGRVVRPAAHAETQLPVVELLPADDVAGMDIGGVAQANGPDGAFTIPDVPPGSYRIQAQIIDVSAGQNAFESAPVASQTIQVSETDLEGITLVPAPPQRLSGLVTWEGAPPPHPGPCFISLSGESAEQMGNLATTAKSDGAFSLEAIPPQRLELTVHCEAAGYYLKAARWGDADVLESGIDASQSLPAGALRVTMAAGAGEVEGSVVDEEQHPFPGATVVLIPETSKRSALFQNAVADQKGRFQFSGVAPGAYSAYAWDEIDPGAWRSEEFLHPYETRAEHVRLDSGGHVAVQLKLIKAAE